MTEVNVDLTTYRDCAIQVTGSGTFQTVCGGETMSANTLRTLEEKIDDFKRAEAKQITVDLSVLDKEGAPCRIIGINLGSGQLITRPAGVQGPFVVNVGDNDALVAKYLRLITEAGYLRRKLLDRGVRESRHGRIKAEEYPGKMQELENSYNNAVEITKEAAASDAEV